LGAREIGNPDRLDQDLQKFMIAARMRGRWQADQHGAIHLTPIRRAVVRFITLQA